MALMPRHRCVRALIPIAIGAVSLVTFTATASAQSTARIEHIAVGQYEIVVDVSLLDEAGHAVALSGLDNATIELDGEAFDVGKAGWKRVGDTESAVAIVVVFPSARDYIEEFFGLRAAVGGLFEDVRPIDAIGYVHYGNSAYPSRMASGADAKKLIADVLAIENSEDIEPNLLAAAVPALGLLRNQEDVTAKYMVVVSDAQGAVVGDDRRAEKLVSQIVAKSAELGVRPLIVGYTPDGPDELVYRKWLKMLAGPGNYLEATMMPELPGAMEAVHERIYGTYQLTLPVGRLADGAHEVRFSVDGTAGVVSDTASFETVP